MDYFCIYRQESKLIRYAGLIKTVMMLFSYSGMIQFILGLTLIVFVVSGGELKAQYVFTSLAMFSVLIKSCGVHLVKGIFLIFESTVAIQRVQVVWSFVKFTV